jgi:hypothetical protein
MGLGVAFCGVADVTSFDVSYDLQVEVVCFGYQGIIGLDALPQIFFEICAIELDGWYQGGDDAKDACAEIRYRVDGCCDVKLVIHRTMIAYRLGQSGINRVNADDQRGLFALYRLT